MMDFSCWEFVISGLVACAIGIFLFRIMDHLEKH